MWIPAEQIQFFMLIFIRVASALAVLPVFSHAATPSMVKAGLAGAIALLLVPVLLPQMPVPSSSVLEFGGAGLRETVCGLLIGFAGQTLFYAVEVAGQLIGFQSGFSIVASIDPNTDATSTVIAQVYHLMAMLLFLTIGGHIVMLSALADSFRVVPVGTLSVDGRLAEWAMNVARLALIDGVRFAAPLVVTLLLMDVGLGILSRIAPALNIFVLGLPLKIAVTMMVMGMTVSLLATAFGMRYAEFVRSIPGFLRLLAGS